MSILTGSVFESVSNPPLLDDPDSVDRCANGSVDGSVKLPQGERLEYDPITETEAYKFVAYWQGVDNIDGQIWDWLFDGYGTGRDVPGEYSCKITGNATGSRYEFKDGSVIVMAAGAWDFGIHAKHLENRKTLAKLFNRLLSSTVDWGWSLDDLKYIWPEAFNDLGSDWADPDGPEALRTQAMLQEVFELIEDPVAFCQYEPIGIEGRYSLNSALDHVLESRLPGGVDDDTLAMVQEDLVVPCMDALGDIYELFPGYGDTFATLSEFGETHDHKTVLKVIRQAIASLD